MVDYFISIKCNDNIIHGFYSKCNPYKINEIINITETSTINKEFTKIEKSYIIKKINHEIIFHNEHNKFYNTVFKINIYVKQIL